MQPINPPRPRQHSRPEVIIDQMPDSPVRRQRRFDNPRPLDIPPAPAVPRDVTLPSPSGETPDAAAVTALRRRAEEAERRERLAREQLEVAKRVSSVPAADPLGDEAIGKLVKAVVSAISKRFGAPAVLVASLLGGGYALKVSSEKPTAPVVTAAQFDDRMTRFEERVGGRLDALIRTTNEATDLQRCLRRKTNQLGESLLPAPDKMGPARRLAAYEDDCPDGPKRLPEPK